METTDFLAPVDENFLCSICHDVMINPCACSQGHQFCRACISLWLQESKSCPSRCGDLDLENLTKLRGAENMICKLHVRCCHAGVDDGPNQGPKNLRRRSRENVASEADPEAECGWTGALEDRPRHLRDDCAYSEVECRCKGCHTKVQRFRLAEHEVSCAHREVPCDKCSEMVKAGEMLDHQLGCALVEIECPQECGARFMRKDLRGHEKECTNMVICCSFAEHGCDHRGKRKKIEEHEEEAAVAHARLAVRLAGRERERNAALEKELAEVKLALARQSHHVERLEGELEASRSHAAQLDQHLACALQAAAGETEGEVKVAWKIEGFTAKAKAKQKVESGVFRVRTRDGDYHLQLYMRFYRKEGSACNGYVGLWMNTVENGGSGQFPADLGGTELTIRKGEKAASKVFRKHSKLPPNSGRGVSRLVRMDRIDGLSWTDADAETRAPSAHVEHDVCDFLDNDTLTVAGCIRVSPPPRVLLI